jgi:kynurenine formamidase
VDRRGWQAAAVSAPTADELAALFASLKNWGRWGAEDERGALNHLRPEHRRAAAALVTDGVTVSLAHDLPFAPTGENPYPAQHHMLAAGDARTSTGIPGYEATRDYVGAHVHGLGVTHVDALCHMLVEGEMYNGRPFTEVRSDGARRNTVMALADGLVGRGVLLDVAAVRGVPYLPGGEVVGVDELRAVEAALGVTVGPGDILLIAHGRDARRDERGGLTPHVDGLAGLHPDVLPWLHEREIAVLGGDGSSDPVPGLGVARWPFPVHQIGITAIGLHLIDNLALGALAAACAERGRYEFLFTMAPLRIAGGTGCPVNPTAVL